MGLRGIVPSLNNPFTAGGAIDADSLARLVETIVTAGFAGLLVKIHNLAGDLFLRGDHAIEIQQLVLLGGDIELDDDAMPGRVPEQGIGDPLCAMPAVFARIGAPPHLRLVFQAGVAQ